MQPLGLTKWPKLIKVWLFLQEPSIEFYDIGNGILFWLDVADHFIKISSCLLEMATADTNQLERFATKSSDIFEKARVSLVQFTHAVTYMF